MHKLIKRNILMICISVLFLIVLMQSVFFSSDTFATNCSVNITTEQTIILDLRPGDDANVVTSDVLASTDCVGGYTMFINGPEDNTLYYGGDDTSSDYISTVSGTRDLPTTLSTDTYGYSLGSVPASSNTFIGLTDELTMLATSDSASSVGGDSYTVSYGAKVAGDKKPGLYQMADNGAIVYSIVANNIITVTFDANGGTIPAGQDWDGSGNTATKDVVPGDTYGNMPAPTRAGYAFLGWSLLPNEYQAVEYIESTGTQYIDTGLMPNQDTGIYADFYTLSSFSTSSGVFGALFGARNGGHVGGFYISTWNGNSDYITFSDGVVTFADGYYRAGLRLNERMQVSIRNKVYTDPNGTTTSMADSLFDANYNLYLFATTLGSSEVKEKGKYRIYNFKIYQGDILVRNFIPCYRKNDDTIGLYDIVNGVFYTNQGTGIFIKGNDSASYEAIVDPSATVIKDDDYTLYAVWDDLYNKNYYFTNASQEFTAPETGYYRIEAYGAGGGRNRMNNTYLSDEAPGGYAAGIIELNKNEKLYIYVGEKGADGVIAKSTPTKASFNGGGAGIGSPDANDGGGAGGGASDVRLVSGDWDDFESLKSRILVAGGGSGGGTIADNFQGISGGSGGGLTATGNVWYWNNIQVTNHTYNATQTTGYKFGIGENGLSVDIAGGAGAGGGYYGGYASKESLPGGAGGGSGFVSGFAGCDAIAEESTLNSIVHTGQNLHYSGKYLINPELSGSANKGNGYVTINYVGSSYSD